MIETGRFKEWAVIEMFGHRKVAGLVTEVELAGATLLRVEVPGEPDVKPQFVGGKSVYNLSLETEQRCRAYAARNPPEVLSRYELPATTERGLEPVDADEVYDEDEDDEWAGDDDESCDLCDDTIAPGEQLHIVKGANGVELTACDKCARAEADTKPTRVPAPDLRELPLDSPRRLSPEGAALLCATIEGMTGLPTEQAADAAQRLIDATCPFCKKRPLRADAGLIETTCGADECARAEGPL